MTDPPPVVPVSRLPPLLASGGTAARVSWPENRAANAAASSAASSASSAAPMALSGPMGLSPSPHPPPWDQRSASPDQRSESRTLQGPSPKEWAAHRETIIDLYRQFPLKKVSDLMRKHHNFSARYVLRIRIRHCARPPHPCCCPTGRRKLRCRLSFRLLLSCPPPPLPPAGTNMLGASASAAALSPPTMSPTCEVLASHDPSWPLPISARSEIMSVPALDRAS